MFTCHACKDKFPTVKILINHLRSLCEPASECHIYSCGETGCKRQFNVLASLRKHISTKHKRLSTPEPLLEQPRNSKLTCEDVLFDSSQLDSMTQSSGSKALLDARNILYQDTSLFLALLHAHPNIPRSVVQIVVNEINIYLVNSMNTVLKKGIEELIKIGKLKESSEIDELLAVIKEPFQNLSTDHKRLVHFKKQGTYIAPIEVVIGERLETSRRNNRMTISPTVSTQQFIPLSAVLKLFFSVKNILTETLHYMHSLSTTVTQNLIQGSVWKSLVNGSETVLPLLIYFDDYEISNPLGSHAGIHKLGAVYVSVPSLPPEYVSLLDNIFLACLFHSSDRTKFGNKVIFERLIEELNYLNVNGVTIDNANFKGIVKFKVAALVGDNLGLNSMTGFVESFTSNHPCRICKANKIQIKSLCYEDESLLRTTSTYFSDLEINNYKLTGIKERCVWLKLNDFDLFNQVGVDLLHDMLEGCCRYVMPFIIKHYIQCGFFQLQTLNQRMFAFDYGPDSNSKPCSIMCGERSNIIVKMSASEMLTFVRYFGLLIGDLVPNNNNVWGLFIVMRKIIDILMCYHIRSETCEQLKVLIAEFNELYIECTQESLKPKFHFLIHYPNMIKKFGPVVNIWTMRFEAKHKISKIIARSSSSRRNICKTIAIRNQLQFNYMCMKDMLPVSVETGKRKVVSEDKKRALLSLFNKMYSNDQVYKITWAKVRGISYKPQVVLTTDILESTNLPSFAIIKELFVYGQQLLFKCTVLDTVGYNDHFYCYDVVYTDTFIYISYDNLIMPLPNNINIAADGRKYVTVRCSLI